MHTQPAHGPRPARGLLAGACVALAACLVPAAAAVAQGDGSASGSDGGSSAPLLLGGAAVLLLAAALIGYGAPALRRRRALRAGEGEGAPLVAHTPAGVVSQPSRSTPEPPGGGQRQFHNLTQTGVPLPDTGTAGAYPPAAGPGAPRPGSSQQSGPPGDTTTQPPRPAGGRGETGRPHARPPAVTGGGRQRALGYTTFPERKRAVSPESRYQARRIRAACEARGMVLHQLVGDVQSYAGPDLERPGLKHALELLAAGEASCLVVAGLDRLSRSAANLGTVIEWLDDLAARLVVIDMDLDTSTEEGRLAARALVRVAELERRDDGSDSHRDRGEPSPSGGRRAAVSDRPLLQRRIATMRASGMTLQSIADTLNKEGVPTLRGGAKWRPSSVQAATGYKRPGREAGEPARAEHEDDGST